MTSREPLEAPVVRRFTGPDLPADISVIIPTCDRPQFLQDALRSVLEQSLLPREIIVVDNGSKPVDARQLPPAVILIRLPPRVGPSRARNHGAAIASGDYVAFLDDDDWWDTGFLENARAAISSDIRCVYGHKYASEGGETTPYKLAAQAQLQIPTLLQNNPGTGGMNLLIDRRLFLRIGGFDEKLRISEDRALALEVLRSGHRIGVAPDAIAVVRHHSSSRLRERHLTKLRFVWKYVGLYTPWTLARTITRILGSAARTSALRFWTDRRGAPFGGSGGRRWA